MSALFSSSSASPRLRVVTVGELSGDYGYNFTSSTGSLDDTEFKTYTIDRVLWSPSLDTLTVRLARDPFDPPAPGIFSKITVYGADFFTADASDIDTSEFTVWTWFSVPVVDTFPTSGDVNCFFH